MIDSRSNDSERSRELIAEQLDMLTLCVDDTGFNVRYMSDKTALNSLTGLILMLEQTHDIITEEGFGE